MPRITYIQHDGTRHDVDVPVGSTVMRGAVDNGIPGIDGDCGGVFACATCHVLVAPEWRDRLPPPVPDETDMLDFAASPAGPGSRLACQLKLSMALDGLSLRLPRSQY